MTKCIAINVDTKKKKKKTARYKQHKTLEIQTDISTLTHRTFYRRRKRLSGSYERVETKHFL